MTRIEASEPRISFIEDENYYYENFYDIEDEDAEQRKSQRKEVPLWDSFKHFPPKSKTGSMQDDRCVNISVAVLKVLVYGLIFLLVLFGASVAKLAVIFAVSQLNPGKVTPYCDYDSEFQGKYTASLSEEGRIAWTWCVVLIFLVPEGINFLHAVWCLLFKKRQRKPKKLSVAVLLLFETLHPFGLALLAFLGLPRLDSVDVAAVSMCVFFVPAVLTLLSRNHTTSSMSSTKFALATLCDGLALMAQSAGIFMRPLLHRNVLTLDAWILPVALVLSSCRWWNNYVSAHSYFGFVRFLWRVKEDLAPQHHLLNAFVSLWRSLVFVCGALLASHLRGTSARDFFRVFRSSEYTVHLSLVSDLSSGAPGVLDLKETVFREVENVSVLVSDGAVMRTVLLQAFCALLTYQVAKFAYRTQMHRPGFALPLTLVGPAVLSAALALTFLRLRDPCVLHDFLPDYLFFSAPDLEGLADPSAPWGVWLAPLWFLSQVWLTAHLWFGGCERLAPVEKIFGAPMYDSLLVDGFLAASRRNRTDGEPVKEEGDYADPVDQAREYSEESLYGAPRGPKRTNCVTQIYACATMWHEEPEEMDKLVSSILRLDYNHCSIRVTQKQYKLYMENYYELETHIFFDDAFRCMHGCSGSCGHDENETQVNQYVMALVETVRKNVEGFCMRASPPTKYPTPYGGRLEWTLPGGTRLTVHLKDKNKIRHRKRWSQVMYMYYLLGYRLMGLPVDVDQKELIAENTYILTLDGDIDFRPSAVKVLVDLMKKDKELGAACGRIHPIGKGSIVWFQKFEYAIGHWLQKSTEHTIGCVLCSPGCFSLFRAKALMQHNVMAKYATQSTEARHYVQYDQGEDRWLCTLILQVGCRVEYSAASDAYTHAPEVFKDFYIQRRRWFPSTVANIFDLLSTAKETREVNNDISWLYIAYQWVLMGSTILGPGMIFLMLVGAFVAAFRIDNWTSFGYNLIPIAVFIGVCFFCKERLQLLVAEIITAFYGLVMIVVLVGIMLQIAEDGWLAPSTLLFMIVAGQLIVAGLLHPQEWSCLLCGVIYYIMVPSMYMLLVIFSIFNLHNVTWGTRESKGAATNAQEEQRTGAPQASEATTKKKRGQFEFSVRGLFSCAFCTYPDDSKEEKVLDAIHKSIDKVNQRLEEIERSNRMPEAKLPQARAEYTEDAESQNASRTTNETDSNVYKDTDEESDVLTEISATSSKEHASFLISPYWLQDERMRSGEVDFLSNSEEEFWKQLIDKYLHPIDNDAEKQNKIAEDLKSMRNQNLTKFFMINALFVLIIFLMQLNKETLHLRWPFGVKYNITYDEDRHEVQITKEYLRLEPIGLVFILGFVMILAIQFLAMLAHRFDTFSHILANAKLKPQCCDTKKFSSADVLDGKHANDIAIGLQRSVENETQMDGRPSLMPSPGRRKTIRELTENAQTAPKIFSNLETFFRRQLDNPGGSGLSRLVAPRMPKGAFEAFERRRSEILSRRRRSLPRNIYNSIDELDAESIYAVGPRRPNRGKFGYDNLAFRNGNVDGIP